MQLISQLDVELGIEKFRAELESTQVLVSSALPVPLMRTAAIPGVVQCWIPVTMVSCYVCSFGTEACKLSGPACADCSRIRMRSSTS